MDHELGEIIFEREFESRDADGNVSPVKMLIGKPQLDTGIKNPNPIVWYCPYQMVGTGRNRVFVTRGQDPLEALLTTLKMAHADLDSFAKSRHQKLTWLGEDYLGLPGYESPRIS